MNTVDKCNLEIKEDVEIKEDDKYYIVYIKSLKVCKHDKRLNNLQELKKIYGVKGEQK